MSIVRKVRAVERLFKSLEKDIQNLKDQTGISCVSNCIKCCTTPKIMATSVEFYPLAYYLYQNHLTNDFLSKMDQMNDPSICPALEALSVNGSRFGCGMYGYRGLICRLFAFNYNTNKYGKRLIAACKTIHMNQSEAVEKANAILENKPIGPKATDYYQRLQLIDFNEAQKLYPIGDAIRTAIETIENYFHYRGGKAM